MLAICKLIQWFLKIASVFLFMSTAMAQTQNTKLLYKTSENLLYVGPAFVKNQLLLVAGNKLLLYSITDAEVKKEIDLPPFWTIHDIVLFDAEREEIIVNTNYSFAYRIGYGAKPFESWILSLKTGKIEKTLKSEYLISSSLWNQELPMVVYHHYILVDSINYYSTYSSILNLRDTAEKQFQRQFISSAALSEDMQTLALGFSNGHIAFANPVTLEISHIDSSSSEAALNMKFSNNLLLAFDDDTVMSIINRVDYSQRYLKCRSLQSNAGIIPSADHSILSVKNENGDIYFYDSKTFQPIDSMYQNASLFAKYYAHSVAGGNLWYMAIQDYDDKGIYYGLLQYDIAESRKQSDNQIVSGKNYQENKIKTKILFEEQFLPNPIEYPYEMMVNQINDKASEYYFDSVYSDKNKEFCLYTDDALALVMRVKDGKILKRFDFPKTIEHAAISRDGSIVAFSFDYLAGMEHINKLVVYDLNKRTGKEWNVHDSCSDWAYSCEMENMAFDSTGKYLFFGAIKFQNDRIVNCLSLENSQWMNIKRDSFIKPIFFPKHEFVQSACFPVVSSENRKWHSFFITENKLLMDVGGINLSLGLGDLKVQDAYSTKVNNQKIFNTSLSNPLWSKLGIKASEYDFYYPIYSIECLNDTIILFSHNDFSSNNYELKFGDIKNEKPLQIKGLNKQISYYSNITAPHSDFYGIEYHVNTKSYKTKKYIAVVNKNLSKAKIINVNKLERKYAKKNKINKREYIFGYFTIETMISSREAFVSKYDKFYILDLYTGKIVGDIQNIRMYIDDITYDFANSQAYIGTASGVIYKWKKETGLVRFSVVQPNIRQMQIHGNDLFVLSGNNVLNIVGLRDGISKGKVVVYQDYSGFPVVSVYSPELFYFTEKSGISVLHISGIDKKIYSAEQFDLLYNRPDKVLQSLGYFNRNTIEIYKQAYRKRLKKMDVQLNDSAIDFHLPDLTVLHINHRDTVQEKNQKFKLHFHDSLYPVVRFDVLLNGVPVHGKSGIPVKEIGKNNYEMDVAIELCEGLNSLHFTALNAAGMSSYGTDIKVVYKPVVKPKKHLYLVNVGVSHYLDTFYNLQYAAKDAADIASLFDTMHIGFDSVIHITLVDEQVHSESFDKLKEVFAHTKRDDAIIMTFAGHGLLDDSFQYYLASHNMDFDLPSKTGIKYEKIEEILDGIPALRKVVFIDACHSGEVDKDELLSVNSKGLKTKPVGRGAAVRVTRKNQEISVSEVSAELFADLRKGSGATVISASGGLEFAMESAELKNGLFTYCLLKGLQSNEADDNGDGEIWVSELQEYLFKNVLELSGGRQKPTTRIRNVDADFRLK